MLFKKITAHIAALFIFICSMPPAFAIPNPGSGDDSGDISARTGEAATFEELTSMLNGFSRTGGTITLSADITVPKGARSTHSASPDSPAVNLDMGEHTIFVDGGLQLFPYLNIYGKGGENGLFHVNRGGNLGLFSITLTASEGYAVYQEDGAILAYGRLLFDENMQDFICNGEIKASEKATIQPLSDAEKTLEYSLPAVTIPDGGELDASILPQTDKAYIYENGVSKKVNIPVKWDLNSEAEALSDGERTVVTGEYIFSGEPLKNFYDDEEDAGGKLPNEVEVIAPPTCLVAFQKKDAAVFLQCLANKDEEMERLSVKLNLMLDSPDLDYCLECSVDGESWWEVSEDDIMVQKKYDDNTLYYFCDFNNEAQLPQYFSLAVTDAKGKTRYSDTIMLIGNDQIGGSDAGGGRNGETDPDEPPLGIVPPPAIPIPPPQTQLPLFPKNDEPIPPLQLHPVTTPAETAATTTVTDPPITEEIIISSEEATAFEVPDNSESEPVETAPPVIAQTTTAATTSPTPKSTEPTVAAISQPQEEQEKDTNPTLQIALGSAATLLIAAPIFLWRKLDIGKLIHRINSIKR